MNRTSKIYLPTKGTGMNSLTSRVSGKGVGTVILDGGIGGQSSYPGGIEEYFHTTSHTPLKSKISGSQKGVGGSGVGLDKLTAKLSSLNVKPPDRGPKKKPISFSI